MKKSPRLNSNSVALLVSSLIVILGLLALILPTAAVRQNHKYSFTSSSEVSSRLSTDPRIAMVLGGGIDASGKPRPVLANRLDAGIKLYKEGMVDRILVTGDNRTEAYNEPEAMFAYLVESGIPEGDITRDFAGRSTYESCERARKVFGIKQMVAVTQTGHLDRTIYLCRSFGIETYGFVADRAGTSPRIGQVFREVIANTKAVFNVYFIGEQTILGEEVLIQ